MVHVLREEKRDHGHWKNKKYCFFLGVDKYMWESCLIVDDIFSIVGKFSPDKALFYRWGEDEAVRNYDRLIKGFVRFFRVSIY